MKFASAKPALRERSSMIGRELGRITQVIVNQNGSSSDCRTRTRRNKIAARATNIAAGAQQGEYPSGFGDEITEGLLHN